MKVILFFIFNDPLVYREMKWLWNRRYDGMFSLSRDLHTDQARYELLVYLSPSSPNIHQPHPLPNPPPLVPSPPPRLTNHLPNKIPQPNDRKTTHHTNNTSQKRNRANMTPQPSCPDLPSLFPKGTDIRIIYRSQDMDACCIWDAC